MKEALAQANLGAKQYEVPVGAVIVHGGKLVSKAHNQVICDHDPMGHAEVLALRQACQILKTPRLEDCDLYVTLEPCPMCAQAISFARIRRLYFGAYDPKGGGVEHGAKIFSQSTCHHRPEVYGGIQEKACGELLRSFFETRR